MKQQKDRLTFLGSVQWRTSCLFGFRCRYTSRCWKPLGPDLAAVRENGKAAAVYQWIFSHKQLFDPRWDWAHYSVTAHWSHIAEPKLPLTTDLDGDSPGPLPLKVTAISAKATSRMCPAWKQHASQLEENEAGNASKSLRDNLSWMWTFLWMWGNIHLLHELSLHLQHSPCVFPWILTICEMCVISSNSGILVNLPQRWTWF